MKTIKFYKNWYTEIQLIENENSSKYSVIVTDLLENSIETTKFEDFEDANKTFVKLVSEILC